MSIQSGIKEQVSVSPNMKITPLPLIISQTLTTAREGQTVPVPPPLSVFYFRYCYSLET